MCGRTRKNALYEWLPAHIGLLLLAVTSKTSILLSFCVFVVCGPTIMNALHGWLPTHRGLFLPAVTLGKSLFAVFLRVYEILNFVNFVGGRKIFRTVFVCGRTCKSTLHELLASARCLCVYSL